MNAPDRQHQVDVPQCWCGYPHRPDPAAAIARGTRATVESLDPPPYQGLAFLHPWRLALLGLGVVLAPWAPILLVLWLIFR